jgi:spore coat polysaccharide biosynthesis protein SpsF
MIAAIIQARMSSTRLPGKIMMETCGKTMLEHMILRVRQSKKLDEVIVATTKNKLDDVIEKWCITNKIKCFRGPENDVLKRFKLTKDYFKVDVIVRLCSDCPLIDPKIIDDVIEIFQFNDYDFVSNLFPIEGRKYPDGMGVEVFSSELLEETDKLAKKPSEREHVTFFMWMQPKKYKIFRLDSKKDLSNFRLNLDYIQDYCLIRSVFEALYYKKNQFTINDIILWLKSNTNIYELNKNIKPNQGWLKSFDEDQKLGY